MLRVLFGDGTPSGHQIGKHFRGTIESIFLERPDFDGNIALRTEFPGQHSPSTKNC